MSKLLNFFIFSLMVISLWIVFSPIIYINQEIISNILNNSRILYSIKLSLYTAAISATIATIISIPIAYYLSMHRGIVSNLIGSISILYLGFPPVGLGVCLLIFLRDYPLINSVTELFGLIFTKNSIIIAQSVIAIPIAIGILRGIFMYLPKSIEELTKIYGIKPLLSFRKVILPVTLPGIISAWIIVWFRCFGEFGATIILAGGTPLYTETLPTAIYNMISLADVKTASALLVISTLIGLITILIYSIADTFMRSRVERITCRL